MSEQNPYIVREEEGKAATIRDFVTGIPLKPEEMLPDEHGIHPVSPLGFLNKESTGEDGRTSVQALGVHGNTTGFIPCKVEDNVEEAYLNSYVVTGKYTRFTGQYIAFPVLAVVRPSRSRLEVVVEGTVPTNESQTFFLRNTTTDDYSVTGLVAGQSGPMRWSANSIQHDGDTTRLMLNVPIELLFDGVVGAGKLDLCVESSTGKKYLCVSGNDNIETTGIFLPGETDTDPFRKVYNYGEIMPNASSADMDVMIGYNSAAENYLEYAHLDGSFTLIKCETDRGTRDYFAGENTVDCTVKHLTDVALVNGLPLIRTYCYFSVDEEWHGPYLSTLVSSDGRKKMSCPQTVPDENVLTPYRWNDCFPDTLIDGDIYYRMSDASSYDIPGYGLCDDLFLYFSNIKYKTSYTGNGYSDREVADWVKTKVGPIIEYARHPYSSEGNLVGAGAFTRWFASCADIDMSGGMGHSQVMVPGFGLGAGYTGECNIARLGTEDEPGIKSSGWLTFGYGTKYDAFAQDVGKTALPLDWPFTEVSSATNESENNITLVRNGVDVNGTRLGDLTRFDECQTCHGTGEVDGDECPDCGGTGYASTKNVMNRIHVCLYNDFTPSEYDYDDETSKYSEATVLKKTFINLGTPLDTADGDEFEITVSLPNVNVDQAFPGNGDADKNQSGYYAFISQPRVYVISGTWKFSDTLVNVVTSASTDTVIVVDKSFLDSHGNELGNVQVRVEMKSSGYPVETSTFTGLLLNNNNMTYITLDEGQTATYTRGAHYTICGAAYLDANNDTLPANSTPIGLNNARRNGEGELGHDYGTGEGIQVYNRMYGVDDERIGREQVIEQSDKRQIVATVYPTVTNTFAWELSGKKTLNHMDSLMTMDAENGADSIMAKVAEMNRNILMGHPEFVEAAQGDFGLGPDLYPIDLQKIEDASYTSGSGYSYIGCVLQVAPVTRDMNDNVNAESNPVRQAIRAVSMLAEDYRNARVRSEPIDIYGGESYIKEPHPVNKEWTRIFAGPGYIVSPDGLNNPDIVTARTIRLRNIANVLSQTATRDDRTPTSPLLGLAPFVYTAGSEIKVQEYQSSNPYGYSEYDTTDALQETQCDFVNNTYGKNYVENSIVMACIRKHPSWLDDPDAVNDLFRAVEVAAIDLGSSAYEPYCENGLYPGMRPFNAFANIVSPDNIPAAMSTASYDDVDADTAKWYGGDAYYYYWLMKDYGDPDDPDNPNREIFKLIATTMSDEEPKYTELTEFLANYIPSYGADLPMRNWDSFRVKIPRASQVETHPVFLTRMKWYNRICGVEMRGKYVADAFLSTQQYPEDPISERAKNYQDVNLNRTIVSNITHNYSATPYALGTTFNQTSEASCAPLNSDTDHGAVAYIRVFMKFTFSADAGRWYCTDYRQAPVSYLTPLYGAQALEEKIDDKRLWVPSSCSNVSWKEATRMLYDDYQPLDINPALVDDVMTERNGKNRIMIPYASVQFGGLGLNVPTGRSGGTWMTQIGGQSANFWSVRENLRPATGALPGTDIPSYQKNSSTGEWEHGHTDGIMSDAVLWGQYDYPTKREIEFHLPDVETPDADLTKRRLIYARTNPDNGNWETGDIQVGSTENVISTSTGAGHN